MCFLATSVFFVSRIVFWYAGRMNRKFLCHIGYYLIGVPALINILLIAFKVDNMRLMQFLMELCFLGIAVGLYCVHGNQEDIKQNQVDIKLLAQSAVFHSQMTAAHQASLATQLADLASVKAQSASKVKAVAKVVK